VSADRELSAGPGVRNANLAGCARLYGPGVRYEEASFGRLATAYAARRTGLGRALVSAALKELAQRFGPAPVRIGAQSYLRRFYEGFGFVVTHGPYDEDGIEHYDMVRPVETTPVSQASERGT
jgi:ElaA protein